MHHRPRKRFSQNFLVDRHYIERIVEAIQPKPGDALVEIGPGRGALTAPLLERAGHLTVLEIDRDLAAALREAYPEDRLTIHVGDALEADLSALGRDLRVVGNLPYHISSPLLFHCARHRRAIRDLHFMLQEEVVDRIAAPPDTADYGRLSVMLQAQFAVRKLFRVPAGAFNPVPAVESAVVRLVPLGAKAPALRDERLFEAVVAAGFGQRRKTLRNALQRIAPAALLEGLGVDPGRRAETLGVEDFVAIANALADAGPAPL
jgi:16S rRNA (adenine1518-N6/adenine1519-N6)-dimethyltransferase